MDKTGLTKRQSGIIVVNKPEHQLPMFVIDFVQSAHEAALANVGAAMAARLSAMGLPAARIQQMLRGTAPPPPGPRPQAYVARPRAPPRRGGKSKARGRR